MLHMSRIVTIPDKVHFSTKQEDTTGEKENYLSYMDVPAEYYIYNNEYFYYITFKMKEIKRNTSQCMFSFFYKTQTYDLICTRRCL